MHEAQTTAVSMKRRSWTEYNRGGCRPTDSHLHTFAFSTVIFRAILFNYVHHWIEECALNLVLEYDLKVYSKHRPTALTSSFCAY